HDLNPHSLKGDFSDANADEDNNGFTNLNEYLAWMAEPHVCTPDGKPVEINLKKLTRGYTNHPSFSISKVDNGKAKITSRKAVFTPNHEGIASLKFKVADASGDTMTRKVNIVSGYNVKFR